MSHLVRATSTDAPNESPCVLSGEHVTYSDTETNHPSAFKGEACEAAGGLDNMNGPGALRTAVAPNGKHAIKLGLVARDGNITISEHVKAAIAIQHTARAWLAKKEITRARRDAKLLMDRSAMIENLARISLSRRSRIYMMMYLVFFTTLMLLFGLQFGPTQMFKSAGMLKENIMYNLWTSGSNAYHVSNPSDWYGFLQASVLDQIEVLNNAAYIYGYQNLFWDNVAGVRIVQERSKTVACSSLYTLHDSTILGSSRNGAANYHSGLCSLPLEDGHDTTTYGTTSSTLDCVQVDTTKFSSPQISPYLSGSSCPSFKYYSDVAFWGGGHMCQIKFFSTETGQTSSTTQWTQYVDMLKRCNFIDNQTRRLRVEMSIFNGNVVPLFAYLQTVHDLSLYGDWFASYDLTSFVYDLEAQSSGTAEYVLMHMLLVWAIIGMVVFFADFLHGTLTRGSQFVRMSVMDFWNYITLVLYVMCIVMFSTWSTLWAGIQSVTNATDATDMAKAAQVLMAYRTDYKRTASLVVFFAVIKVLSYFRHRGKLSMVTVAFRHVAAPLLHYLGTLMIILMGFALGAWHMFGSEMWSFHTVSRAVDKIMAMCFGGSDYKSFWRIDQEAATVFYFVFSIFFVMILLSFFIAIIMEGYRHATALTLTSQSLWTEAILTATATLQGVSSRRTTADDLLVMLQFARGLSRQKTVSLCDVKRVARHSFDSEAAGVLTDAMLSHGANKETVLEAMTGGPYRYIVSDAWSQYLRRVGFRNQTIGRVLERYLPSHMRTSIVHLARVRSAFSKMGPAPRKHRRVAPFASAGFKGASNSGVSTSRDSGWSTSETAVSSIGTARYGKEEISPVTAKDNNGPIGNVENEVITYVEAFGEPSDEQGNSAVRSPASIDGDSNDLSTYFDHRE